MRLTRIITQPCHRFARVFIFGVLAFALTVFAAGVGTSTAQAQEIVQLPPGTLACGSVITFDDVAGGPAPGANFDAVFTSVGANFAERFVGQTLSFSGNFDVLSSAAVNNPLTLQVGAPSQNLHLVARLSQAAGELQNLLADSGDVGRGQVVGHQEDPHPLTRMIHPFSSPAARVYARSGHPQRRAPEAYLQVVE